MSCVLLKMFSRGWSGNVTASNPSFYYIFCMSASLDKVSLCSPAANASSIEGLQRFLTRSKRISLEKQTKDQRAESAVLPSTEMGRMHSIFGFPKDVETPKDWSFLETMLQLASCSLAGQSVAFDATLHKV